MIYSTKLHTFLSSLPEKQRVLEEKLLSDSANIKNVELQRELSRNRELIAKFNQYNKYISDYEECRSSISKELNPELKELLTEECGILEKKVQKLEAEFKSELLPSNKYDGKNIFIEMHSAAGGEEAAIFVSNLFDSYKKYAQENKWKLNIVELRESEKGFAFITFTLSGEKVYSKMKYESGVHRVQRVPETESKGRVHTSTVTVSVLPEPDEIEVEIDPSELRIDVYRASGAGGQHVNKTESAVRIVHLPTNIMVACQQERSQTLNKEIAFKILKAKLWEREMKLQQQELFSTLKQQIGKGERAEKIRTYNYPQNRMTDHRIPLTINNLISIMEGNLSPIHQPLSLKEQEDWFNSLVENN
ncbi:peptide chain release factor 1 [Candidatus Mycoplasma haematolamae str. Purdue]|uniref:Peptide chain release factor 1 n=1 Tax=Mycoplasma haematolamae (strain Purdue) TaxID=1212765 RepID=I7CH45_MYCHA|nr:peptide chain release factor 1 [Candidatus Mycoplasma haematolamae]AFO52486.1 peptide chain release factor 1 [Candidatus Mycoplasma haematolamae str. Purdue]